MKETLIVRGAPQEYICEIDCWNGLEERLIQRGLQHVLVVHGKASWEVAKAKFPRFNIIQASFEEYHGESSYEERDRLIAIIKAQGLDGIVAVGGGKISDVVKAAAAKLHIPSIILPTMASTCAAYTPLSVMYNEKGEMTALDIFPTSNSLVLVDPEIILNSPIKFMVAGIGDTLAKWYEARVVIEQIENPPVEVEVAYFAAKLCHSNLLAYSESALEAMERQEINSAFIKIVETNILVAGMVGGFGDEYGRTAGAHSIHDALTIVPASHRQLHGNKVAYSIFLQLILEGKVSEIAELIPFYQQLGLPISLADMGLAGTSPDLLRKVAELATAEGENIHLLPDEITAEKLFQAFATLEEYQAEFI
ncbi:iron-containing alcohol dehydrogenase family protein [Carnobacterium gallinarum]|uniref:iron-containing alcohol dehydrogenase family protein n=1 Tax=Carnobacterium gallinarum TaxID=2749 RepID=UPI000556A588|nr:iron-containing alcohol dehydrogenase family protein [Carnobacterium gallinarum]